MRFKDLRAYQRCPRMFWLKHHQPLTKIDYVYHDEQEEELLRKYLGIDAYFDGTDVEDQDVIEQALLNYDACFHIHIVIHGIQVHIPLLLKKAGSWILYTISMTTYPKDHEIYAIKAMWEALQSMDIQPETIYSIHLNPSYERQTELDVNSLFLEESYLYHGKKRCAKTILEMLDEISLSSYWEYKSIAQECLTKEIPSVQRCKACFEGNKCIYFSQCYPKVWERDHILYLFQSHKKYAWIKEGKTSLLEVDVDELEGTCLQYAQIMAARNGGFYLDRIALQEWIATLQKPYSYLDFEWETYAIPPYEGLKPMDVVVFQYSLHVEHADRSYTHHAFLEKGDCREAFILQLLQEIPKEGSILVYNMDGAEKRRLKELAKQFPSYQKQLYALCDRMVDLSLPFASGVLYDLRMKGRYSLKTLVDVFSTKSYHELDVQNGMDAVSLWRRGIQNDQIRKQLLAYCEMDTYGEMLILHMLLELLEKE